MNNDHKTIEIGGKGVMLLLATIGLSVSAFAQGILTPLGAPAPTMKTLDQIDSAITDVSNTVEQVEARIDLATLPSDTQSEIAILSSGSYYLSSNLDVGKQDGIRVGATDVTIDLNGFRILRTSGSGGNGININGARDRVTIRNGFISGFEYGIRSYTSPARPMGCMFRDLAISDCSEYGISAGDLSHIRNCRIFNNDGIGIYTGENSIVSKCLIKNCNGSIGLYANSGSILESCSVEGCQSTYGYRVSYNSSLNNCTLMNCEGTYGFHVNAGSTIRGCSARDNLATYTFYISPGCDMSHCTAYSNDGYGSISYGIFANASCSISDCVSSYNSHTNSTTTADQGVGIYASDGGSIKNCTVSKNKGDGIRVQHDCSLTDNICESNGYSGGDGAGIRVLGRSNRVDNNHVVDNDRGIEVALSGNIIVRNTTSGNGINLDIAAGNKVGGFSADPSTAGPWDNFGF